MGGRVRDNVGEILGWRRRDNVVEDNMVRGWWIMYEKGWRMVW